MLYEMNEGHKGRKVSGQMSEPPFLLTRPELADVLAVDMVTDRGAERLIYWFQQHPQLCLQCLNHLYLPTWPPAFF